MKKMIVFIFFFVLLFSLKSFGYSDSIPFEILISQLVNVSLLGILIYFSQRKRVIHFFQKKKEDFLKNVEQSRELKRQAQTHLEEITRRFDEMSDTFDKKVRDAEQNAQRAYQNQVNQAKNQALHFQEIVQRNFEFEAQKQMENLRKETFLKSTNIAESEIKGNFPPERLKAWNDHFISSQEIR